MLSLREFRNRLHVHHGYELSKKPRELDCLIIDIDDSGERIDNEIAQITSDSPRKLGANITRKNSSTLNVF